MKKFMIASLMVFALLGHAQDNKPQPSEAEIARMKSASPKVATVKPAKPRKVLVFMDTKGFYHTSIPFATKALQIIGETTGAFTVAEVTDDTSAFEPEHLKEFDVIFLNNNTSRLPIGGVDYTKMPAGKERDAAEAREMRLRNGLLDFARKEGKGVFGIHAAIDAFYTWPEYGEMMGGYFNLHPWSETVGVELVDAGHPLMRGWRGIPFSINEEIYQVKEPYSRDKQRIFMRLDVKRTNMNKGDQIRRKDGDFALAWLKNYGKGRVVYIGFGHRHETFWNPGMMQMMLDAMQYCAGDLKCDERPSNVVDDAYNAMTAEIGFARGLQDIIPKLAQYQYSIDDTEARQIEYLVNDAEAPGKGNRAKQLATALAGLLKPESTIDARNFALRQLSRIGGTAEIPAIESQFADEKTAVMALYALQRIPDAAAEQAMIRSLDAVPRERAATAIALGRKKCAAAVAPLAKLLNDDNYGPAAALGIGMIGTKEAAQTLAAALPTVKQALRRDIMIGLCDAIGALPATDCADACQALLAADDCLPNAKAAAQAKAFIAAGEKADVEQILNKLKSGDVLMKAAVAHALPEINGALPKVVAAIDTLPADAACFVMDSIAESKNKAFEADAIRLLASKNDQIAMTAARTLETIGGAAAVLPLAKLSADGEGARKNQARHALYRMVGDDVDAKIRSEAVSAANDAAFRAELIRALGGRLDKGSVKLLADNALSDDKEVRKEATAALALVAGEKDLPTIINLLTKVTGSAERTQLKNMVINIGKRAEDQTAASAAIIAALNGDIASSSRVALLEALGKLANNNALPVLTAACKSDDAAVKRIAILALGEWPTPEPLDTLRAISRDDAASLAHKVLALRGYARMLALPSPRPVKETLDLYKEALALAKNPQEKGSLINGLGYLLHPEALKLAKSYLDVPELANEAVLSATRIMNGLNGAAMKLTSSHGGSQRNAIDGNTATRWTSGKAQAGDEWFQIDMGYSSEISEIKLFAGETGNDFPVEYKVYVTEDTANWGKPVLEGKGSDRNMLLKPNAYGRYIKIVQTGRGTMYWSICEMQINGVPADAGSRLDNATLKLSASKNAENVKNAVDGNANTRWDTNAMQAVGDWFMIELPKVMTVKKIVMDATKSANDFPKGYRIDVSMDGKDWKGPVGMGNGSGAITTAMLLDYPAKFVKITLTEATDKWFWSIHGLSVFAE